MQELTTFSKKEAKGNYLFAAIDMTDDSAVVCADKSAEPAPSADRIAAAINKIAVYEQMLQITYALEHLGIIRAEQHDRLVDTIKRLKHGV